MAEFSEIRDQLQQTRLQTEQARLAAFLARERVQQIGAELGRLERVYDPQNQDHVGRRAALQDRLAHAEAEAKQAATAHSRLLEAERGTLSAFVPLADPRTAVSHWSDDFPVLLMPIRIETRFKTITNPLTPPKQQLWVRIYPDDCAVDSFEPVLSDGEVQNAQAYWQAVWFAGGEEEQERAAWRSLAAAHGTGRAWWIVQNYRPLNEPGDGEPIFPSDDEVATRRLSWSQAPRVNVLPDRFVLLGYSGGAKVLEQLGAPVPAPLVVGPDPSVKPEEGLHPTDDGGLHVPDEMKWMVDFEEAVARGLGFKVDLTPAQASQGFDRLLVLGLRLSADEQKGRAMLEELIDHHHHGRSGFSLLPQGTPTNNTEGAPSGFSKRDNDADAAFDDYFKNGDLFTDTPDWLQKQDGQWLAEALGIDAAVLGKVPHSGGGDQREARAMNVALWPATLGYLMQTMMEPVFGSDAVESTRWFFNQYVSGRGMVPAVRIGSQPYGILPATVHSRMAWMNSERLRRIPGIPYPDDIRGVLNRLYALLRLMEADWRQMAGQVSYVGKKGDAHKILLDILGLHPGSVEWYQRYAESVEHLFNRAQLEGTGAYFVAALLAGGYVETGMQLLKKLGYSGDERPDVLEQLFFSGQNKLKGPVVDDRPLSETDPIRAYTTDGKNYIEWLAASAKASLETVRMQQGFVENKAPTALLYLMLRHALQLSYWDTSLRLHLRADLLDQQLLKAAVTEPKFIHVKEQQAASESRYQYLYKAEPKITQDPHMLVADYIPKILGLAPEAQHLNEMIKALEVLQSAPTARLERAFAEHVDTLTYRLDAWQQGLVQFQLASMRLGATRRGLGSGRHGLYLGAYGWLEEVRPENKQLSPVTLPPDLAEHFKEGPPLVSDNTNGGYIHAPSINHAVTAAVLRNGYIANATPANPQMLSVNLSSERVRVALAVLEGMRGGQSLGALLGYQFERGLHDRHSLAEVDQFIYKLRKAFPLKADQLKETKTDDDVPIEAIEARNVMDGLALVEHIRGTGLKLYPFGKSLPAATPAQATAINAEVDRLLDTHDAVADLALAEGVHQAVQSNYDRAAATLDGYSKGHFPPEPDVVATPRSGITLTHRVGLHLEAGLDPALSPLAGIPVTPRAMAQPALNKWLAAVMPAPAGVACTVVYGDPATIVTVTQADLGLQPIDLLYLVQLETDQAMTEMDDRIVRYVVKNLAPRPDTTIAVKYLEPVAGKVSFFELAPLLRSLRALALRSRPLTSGDIALANEATEVQEQDVTIDLQRVLPLRDGVAALQTDLTAFGAQVDGLTDGQKLSQIDSLLDSLVELLVRSAALGLPQTGWGFAYDWKRNAFASLLQKVRDLIARWNAKLAEFDGLVAAYDALPGAVPYAERFALLQQAEWVIATVPTDPLPGTPSVLRAMLDGKRTAFAGKKAQFTALLPTPTTSLAVLLASIESLLPIDAYDREGLDLSEHKAGMLTFAGDLRSMAAGVAADAGARLTAANDQITLHGTATTATAKVKALQRAAAAILGEEVKLIPEFALAEGQGDEWEKALAAGQSGDLLRHQTGDLQVDFPVDEWLYGAARVREKLRHWEQAVMLAGAFGLPEPELTPIQLPYKADDHWLGLQFPAAYKIDSDRLLYTAHYGAPFIKATRQCGLLLDEWTEVIPADTETTGIAFHYDRPNAEPPQVMLLVTPPDLTGAWQWQDLVDTLHETLDLAKQRAVEPAQVDATAYARFLPATMMAVTLYQISIAANLGINNKVFDQIGGEGHGG